MRVAERIERRPQALVNFFVGQGLVVGRHLLRLSPVLIRRRMASDWLLAPFSSDQAPISSIISTGKRIPTNGSRPVAGLPLLFCLTAIDRPIGLWFNT
jgi:hypothetical protein